MGFDFFGRFFAMIPRWAISIRVPDQVGLNIHCSLGERKVGVAIRARPFSLFSAVLSNLILSYRLLHDDGF